MLPGSLPATLELFAEMDLYTYRAFSFSIVDLVY